MTGPPDGVGKAPCEIISGSQELWETPSRSGRNHCWGQKTGPVDLERGHCVEWDKGGLARAGPGHTDGERECVKCDQVLGLVATFQAGSLVFSTGGLAPPGTA